MTSGAEGDSNGTLDEELETPHKKTNRSLLGVLGHSQAASFSRSCLFPLMGRALVAMFSLHDLLSWTSGLDQSGHMTSVTPARIPIAPGNRRKDGQSPWDTLCHSPGIFSLKATDDPPTMCGV